MNLLYILKQLIFAHDKETPEYRFSETEPTQLSYTVDATVEYRPKSCMRCGTQFRPGTMVHEIPLDDELVVVCGWCAQDIRDGVYD